eukprot:2703075-Prymnesium_polylepis.1
MSSPNWPLVARAGEPRKWTCAARLYAIVLFSSTASSRYQPKRVSILCAQLWVRRGKTGAGCSRFTFTSERIETHGTHSDLSRRTRPNARASYCGCRGSTGNESTPGVRRRP